MADSTLEARAVTQPTPSVLAYWHLVSMALVMLGPFPAIPLATIDWYCGVL